MDKGKIYYKEWFIWIMLICFAPIGVALLFSNESIKYNSKTKTIISVIYSVFFIMYIILKYNLL